MVSARGLVCGLKRRSGDGKEPGFELLRTHPADNPLVVQLFGAEPEYLAAAARELVGRGYMYFDLNMGCPAPKVVKSGAGAALLRDPARAALVARALFRAAGEGRAGCKLRLGADAATSVYLELGQRLADEGAAWLTLHPRHGKQGFSGIADVKAVELLAGKVNIPVLASGDLFLADDAVKYLNVGATGVMFGRGALADPFIFRKYLALAASGSENARPDGPSYAPGAPGGENALDAANAKEAAFDRGAEQAFCAPDAEDASYGGSSRQALDALLRHAHLSRTLLPAPVEGRISPALLKMRSIAPRYLRNSPGIKRLRAELIRCRTWEELYDVLRGFFPGHPEYIWNDAGAIRREGEACG
jgi:tRNA-dihydrouridine synthase B